MPLTCRVGPLANERGDTLDILTCRKVIAIGVDCACYYILETADQRKFMQFFPECVKVRLLKMNGMCGFGYEGFADQ